MWGRRQLHEILRQTNLMLVIAYMKRIIFLLDANFVCGSCALFLAVCSAEVLLCSQLFFAVLYSHFFFIT